MSNFAKAQAARELTFQQLQTKNDQLQQCLNVAVKLLKEVQENKQAIRAIRKCTREDWETDLRDLQIELPPKIAVSARINQHELREQRFEDYRESLVSQS